MVQNSTPGCLPKENRNTDGKGCMHPHAHSGVPYDSQNRNTPQCPSGDKQVEKKCTYRGVISSLMGYWSDKGLVSIKGRTFSSKNGNHRNDIKQAVVLFLKDPQTQAFRSKRKKSCSWKSLVEALGCPERPLWSPSLSGRCARRGYPSCFGDSIFVHFHNLIFIKVYSNG